MPKRVVRRISSRYIAGIDIGDACRVVAGLNEDGKMATIDILGEEITSAAEADEIVRAYHDVFEAIRTQRLDSNVSIKPTALGLELGYRLARENIETVVRHAAESGNFVRIDMEDSSTTDDTLRIYRELREAGLDNVGVVLQARLRRTLQDVAKLADLAPNVRICKGIYVAVLDELLGLGSYVGIATHDEWLIAEGERLVAVHGREREEYEFQMLLGVRKPLGDRLVADDHRLRIYVPYGEHWYAYSLRRLQENPKIAGYIAADTLGRLVPGRGNGRP